MQAVLDSLASRGKLLRPVYVFGVPVCLVALPICFCIVVGAALNVTWLALHFLNSVSEPSAPSRLGKRDSIPRAPATSSAPLLEPILPGVNASIWSLPVLLICLAISGVVHELGHATAARLERITPEKAGVRFYGLLPAFYVALPSQQLSLAPPISKLRILCAGIVHNLLLCLLLALLSARHGLDALGWLEEHTFWQDAGSTGIVLQSISTSTPLASIITVDSVLTHLDDLELHGSHLSGRNHWRRFLLDGPTVYESMGRCFPAREWDLADSTCCQVAQPGGEVCLDSLDDQRQACMLPQYWLDLHVATLDRTTPGRCLEQSDCVSVNDEALLCIAAAPSSNLTRVTYLSSVDGERQTTLYQGDRARLYDTVRVGRLQRRTWARWLVPSALPGALEDFIGQLNSVSLSMAFLNLLTINRLDGAEILKTSWLWLEESHQFLPGGIISRCSTILWRARRQIDRILLRATLPMLTYALAGSLALSLRTRVS
ncbi:uncharacterized protein L969DRAFT_91880 [Mixia osmundae IAM 14324]|uniref:Endopeptidase S2P n=1 Tax=Mixia osmundae (strain CBS 9802 / IAM 14324 / JCM 22182 / KY 12970) TaxID=764103 RepID=G7E391_MIXOS|nr:uncharacterized protein L969DRAFT_91880 [Mixia osmundae IAM 14324]KEI42439.1 hypothetical protein L969DRAFT_91880 [Mixia osmundae IAM 14324]GAA97272.1 hypothetical protein E5Q_03949 [Mixia osmundae IAM 14324]